MKTKNPAATALRHAKKLLALIPPNLALETNLLDDLECLVGAALNRVKGIRAGLFTVENSPQPPSEEQLRAAMEHFQPPSAEQLAEFERFNKGPTRADRKRYGELTRSRTRLEKKLQGVDARLRKLRPLLDEGDKRVEQERDKNEVLDDIVRAMAGRKLKPAEISQSLRQMFGYPKKLASADLVGASAIGELEAVEDPNRISAESLSEKAINARLYRLRTKGFKQPISPTAKNRRKNT
jgi:hypothetical protein